MLVKKMIKTLFILIGILVAAMAICIGVMAIFPSVSIFGFYFVNENYSSNKIEITDSPDLISNVIFETDKYNIEIVRDDNAVGAYLQFESRYVGLVKENEQGELIKNAKVLRELNEKTLSIYTKEPTGLVVPMNTKITLFIGRSQPVSDPNKNLSISLTKLDVKVGSGDLKVTSPGEKYFSIDEFNLNRQSTSGNVSLNGIKVNSKINLNYNYGQIDLSNAIAKDDSGSAKANVNISTKYGSFTFDSVNSLTITDGVAPYIVVNDTINGDVKYKSKSGTLIVKGNVGSMSGTSFNTFKINADEANIDVGNLASDIIVWNYADDNAISNNTSLKIGSLGTSTQSVNKKRIIKLENGSIKIEKIYANNDIDIETVRGDINLGVENSNTKFISSNVKALSKNGEINVYFDGLSHYFEITSTFGKINANGLNPSSEANSIIKSLDSAPIYANFNEINNPVSISAYNKNVNITVPENGAPNKIHYKLQSTTGDITVNLDIRQRESYWFGTKHRLVNSNGIDYPLTINEDNTIDTQLVFDEETNNIVKFKYENPYLVSYNSNSPLLDVRTTAGNINISER